MGDYPTPRDEFNAYLEEYKAALAIKDFERARSFLSEKKLLAPQFANVGFVGEREAALLGGYDALLNERRDAMAETKTGLPAVVDEEGQDFSHVDDVL